VSTDYLIDGSPTQVGAAAERRVSLGRSFAFEITFECRSVITSLLQGLHIEQPWHFSPMIRNLHMLMALPSADGEVSFAAKKAEFLPVEGLRLYFPSGHQTRLEKIEYWLKRLHRNPIPWLKPSEEKWIIELEGAKQRFSNELVKSYPYSPDATWPHWLDGSVALSPELETGSAFQPRLALFLTELAIAKAKAPPPQSSNSSGTVLYQFIKEVHHMSSDQYHVSGQAGSVGPHSRAEGNTFVQQWAQSAADLDLPVLAAELATLRAALRRESQEIEHDQVVASVGSAEAAANRATVRAL
jgi:hypothetical protein